MSESSLDHGYSPDRSPESPQDARPAPQRKLVRPVLPEQATRVQRRAPSPLLTHQDRIGATPRSSSHAEVFYFQKQMQAQTPMVFVLEDGERIEGIIEWYDAHSIKVRHTTRTLIYKSAIKYLYKAGDDGAGRAADALRASAK